MRKIDMYRNQPSGHKSSSNYRPSKLTWFVKNTKLHCITVVEIKQTVSLQPTLFKVVLVLSFQQHFETKTFLLGSADNGLLPCCKCHFEHILEAFQILYSA